MYMYTARCTRLSDPLYQVKSGLFDRHVVTSIESLDHMTRSESLEARPWILVHSGMVDSIPMTSNQVKIKRRETIISSPPENKNYE
ncbi:hypothetical protein HYQ45_010187 [Verticillium longisporum]|uniref:Uncharacterized protein n=1 Tax=Verticillium longisporum TaxID=100787 RepID=A0A8I2ZJA6_VERLO|nr:hypothetical protein HYQ45_010187 [Verticillium longisporum]